MKKKFISPEMEILFFDEIEMDTLSTQTVGNSAKLGGMDTAVDMAAGDLGKRGANSANITITEANSIF